MKVTEHKYHTPKGYCIYCRQPIGEDHLPECVKITKLVLITTSIQHLVEVPESWDDEMINFHYMDSSRCGNNFVYDIIKFRDYIGEKGDCLCHYLVDVQVDEVQDKSDWEGYER